MKTPLISVIVPVYKVEAYLDRCVQSIVDQTYPNLEIILVDDGSPDNCGAMCDAWAQRDSRIKVIHKENGGLSDARNAGMAAATGTYMGFVDSDDYLDKGMYRLLLEQMTAAGSDIAACGVELVYEDGRENQILTRSGSCILNREGAMEAVIRESWLKQPVWYKLYKSERIRDIPFPVGKYHEDVFWTWQAVARAERVSVTDTPCYYYVQRSGSIMGQGYSLKRLDALEAKEQRLAWLEKNLPELAKRARQDFLFSAMYQGQQIQADLPPEERPVAFAKLNALREQCPLSAEDKSMLPAKQRVWAELAEISFCAACWLRNCLKIGL